MKERKLSMNNKVPKNMKAAVMHSTREISIETLPVPGINHDEVLIKVMAVGICGSDLHYYTHGRIGKYIVEKPFILGHECSGVIAAVGSSVYQFKVGDRVAVERGPGVRHRRRPRGRRHSRAAGQQHQHRKNEAPHHAIVVRVISGIQQFLRRPRTHRFRAFAPLQPGPAAAAGP